MQRTFDRNEGLCTPCGQQVAAEAAERRLQERQRTLIPIHEEDWLRSSPCGGLVDEAAALGFCLALLEVGPKQVIEASTGLGVTRYQLAAEDLERTAYYLQSHLSTLATETICDFIGKNRRSHPTADLLSSSEEFTLISDQEIADLFRGEDGWERFRVAFPCSRGIATVARVGLSADSTQALVCAGLQFDGLMGHGTYWVLQRREGVWEETESRMAWVS